MNKYTFICEFQGGTYISQYKAKSLLDGLIIWADNLSLEVFTEKNKLKIISQVASIDTEPIAIKGIENVWCDSYTVNRSLLLLNIIKTI